MSKWQSGLTLFDLILVVLTTGLLTAIAVPQYRDYVVRSNVTEALSIVRPYQNNVTEAAAMSELTSISPQWRKSQNAKYVTWVTQHANGVIEVQTKDTGAKTDPRLRLSPLVSGGSVNWQCERMVGLARHVPSQCRTQGDPFIVKLPRM